MAMKGATHYTRDGELQLKGALQGYQGQVHAACRRKPVKKMMPCLGGCGRSFFTDAGHRFCPECKAHRAREFSPATHRTPKLWGGVAYHV